MLPASDAIPAGSVSCFCPRMFPLVAPIRLLHQMPFHSAHGAVTRNCAMRLRNNLLGARVMGREGDWQEFAADSSQEGGGFEPSVPREGIHAHETAQFDRYGISLRPQRSRLAPTEGSGRICRADP